MVATKTSTIGTRVNTGIGYFNLDSPHIFGRFHLIPPSTFFLGIAYRTDSQCETVSLLK